GQRISAISRSLLAIEPPREAAGPARPPARTTRARRLALLPAWPLPVARPPGREVSPPPGLRSVPGDRPLRQQRGQAVQLRSRGSGGELFLTDAPAGRQRPADAESAP